MIESIADNMHIGAFVLESVFMCVFEAVLLEPSSSKRDEMILSSKRLYDCLDTFFTWKKLFEMLNVADYSDPFAATITLFLIDSYPNIDEETLKIHMPYLYFLLLNRMSFKSDVSYFILLDNLGKRIDISAFNFSWKLSDFRRNNSVASTPLFSPMADCNPGASTHWEANIKDIEIMYRLQSMQGSDNYEFKSLLILLTAGEPIMSAALERAINIFETSDIAEKEFELKWKLLTSVISRHMTLISFTDPSRIIATLKRIMIDCPKFAVLESGIELLDGIMSSFDNEFLKALVSRLWGCLDYKSLTHHGKIPKLLQKLEAKASYNIIQHEIVKILLKDRNSNRFGHLWINYGIYG